MREISERDSANKVEERLRVTAARLHAHPKTAEVAPSVLGWWEELKGVREAHQEARINRLAVSAELSWLDEVVDGCVMDLSRDLLSAVDGDRAHPRYQAAFPTSPSAAMRLPGDAQDQYVRLALRAVQAWPECPEAVGRRAEALAQAQAALEAGQVRQRAVYEAEAEAWTALGLALARIGQAYNRLYARLLGELPDHKRLINTMF